MTELFEGDLHAGLSGLELGDDCLDLGEGISLRKTYAHLMAPFIMAFNPAPPGRHHPAPWKASRGGFSFDITVDLTIPASFETIPRGKVALAKTIVFLVRLGLNPAATVPVLSNYPFADLANNPDNEAALLPFEIQYRYFPLTVDGGLATNESAEWVRSRWQTTHELISESAEFALAVDAISTGQFVKSSALTLVSLWGALEALFSPSTTELKFRVSSLIAAFLEPFGNGRGILQKEIAKLYDKRSAAAHGKPKHDEEDVLGSFNLLRRVLMRIIDNKKVPSREDLEDVLFGSLGKLGD
ncbi:MAG TPA: hypothetical protein VNX70_15020 [Bryobacteraceae bacterium]|jgi:hypothetical protein|nr:hypothetical protein [Bryobacteraceae bacterium]